MSKKQQVETDEQVQEGSENAVDQPNEAVVELEAELSAQRDRILRLQAEMENLRQRQAREINDVRRYGAMPVIRDILPVVDNIDRALEASEKSQGSESLLDGFRLVRQQLITALSQNGCTAIEAEGTAFDPDLHEAILQQPSDEHPAGTIVAVTQQGYKLHDRIVRPAQVIVSSGPAQ